MENPSTQVLTISQLQRCRLFSGIGEPRLSALASICSSRTLAAGQTLFWHGEPVGHVFLVLDGAINLERRVKENQRKVIDIVEGGRIIGLHSMFSPNGYYTTAVAACDTHVLACNAERFLHQLKRTPELGWRIAVTLSDEVERLLSMVEQLSAYSAAERLAAYLLENHCDEDGAAEDRAPRRRADLASLLSLTPEALCREISRFRRLGVISTDDGTFQVLNPEPLETIVRGQAES